jgi:hypothetical protein
MIPRRRSAKKNGRNLKKLQTDAQNPDSIGNLDRRPLTISLPSFESNQSRPPPDCAKREENNVDARSLNPKRQELRNHRERSLEIGLPVVMGC